MRPEPCSKAKPAAHFVQGLDGEEGTGGADRVTEGDAAAVRVGPILRQAEFFNYSGVLLAQGLMLRQSG
jgi:hypothetical protein